MRNLQPGTNEFHDMIVNVACYSAGAKPKAAVAELKAAPAPTPVAVADCSTRDSDNDGVNDCNDECPTTLPGVQVSNKGCWIVDGKI